MQMKQNQYQSWTKQTVTNSTMVTVIVSSILVCVPFIQMGYQYYLSTMILAFALAICLLRPKDALSLAPRLVLVLILMLLPVVFYLNSGHVVHSLLRAGREYLCFALVYVFLVRAKHVASRGQPNMAIVNGGLVILAVGLLCFVIVQYVFLKRGIIIFLPAEYYITNINTIPTALDVQWVHVRPSASFGEPSYLGFIVTSLLVIILYVVKKKKTKLLLIACILVTVLFASTLAGVISCFSLVFLFFWRSARKPEVRTALLMASVLVVTLASLSGYDSISKRITNLTDKNVESSGNARIIGSLEIAGKVMLSSPIGIPTDELSSTSDLGETANGFMNLIINYGVTGILIMVLFVRAARKNTVLVTYLFFASMFNGGILAFDKAAIMSLVIFLISISQREEIVTNVQESAPSRTGNDVRSNMDYPIVRYASRSAESIRR